MGGKRDARRSLNSRPDPAVRRYGIGGPDHSAGEPGHRARHIVAVPAPRLTAIAAAERDTTS
ncbi:MAG TPA: hypothetical protein VEC76_06515 [Streptosporangiaceae bacterium]|nr:hypothetical protein [Streptosporangiaceae bacterium]